MRSIRYTVLLVLTLTLILLANGILCLGSNVQTPSRQVQTPSMTVDLTSDYGFDPGKANKLLAEYGGNRIKYAIDNSTTLNSFYLYLLSPDTSVEVENSCIYVVFSHPKTGKVLKKLQPRVTIADKKEKSLELTGTMEIEDNNYKLCVDEGRWLVTPKARTHTVYIDVGQLEHIRFEVKVTETGKIERSE